jgi:hypothetical protein
MTEQEPLIADADVGRPFDPFEHHIWPRYIADGGLYLNTLAWNRARADRSYVGTCRMCGGYLIPEPSDAYPESPDTAIVWYGAVCRACGREFVAPDGKVLQRSARHSQMPRTFLRTRAGIIAAPRSEGG